MTDIGTGRAAKPGVRFGFERQQRQEMIRIDRHFPRPPRTPRPDRWRHIVDDRHVRALLAKTARNLMGEIGAVDNQQHMRIEGACGGHGLVDAPHDQRQAFQHIAEAHDGDVRHRKDRLQARRQHVVIADARDDQVVAQPLSQGRQQFSAEPVARVLTRYCEHAQGLAWTPARIRVRHRSLPR